MPRRSTIFIAHIVLVAALATLTSGTVVAQEPAASIPKFATGVLTTIAPDVARVDMVSEHDIIELLANAKLQREPNFSTKSRTLYEMAQEVDFRRDVWCLELSFKPLRMLAVDIPQSTGRMQRKLIWYMVYRVRNTGVGLTPTQQDDGTFAAANQSNDELRFVPQFLLTSQDSDRRGKQIHKTYLDRILPAAVVAIQRREFSNGELLNSVEITEKLLQAESGRAIGGLWGVAMWEDVDPEIDFFSVFVRGLTNAYQWRDNPDGFQEGDPPGKGRRFLRKQLQLNFWRPGDSYAENEREIRYGVAPGEAGLYGVGEGVAYQWVYR